MTNMPRPSKQFIIRGSIATGIVALILLVQTDWVRSLLKKKPLPPPVVKQTVGDIVSKDSNENGIADWEERLWGLDPSARYTDGIPNKTIIENKKKALGVPAVTEPQNETDALARELFTITMALGQSGDTSKQSLSDIAAKLADSVEFKHASNRYALKDIHTVATTSASLQHYYELMAAVSSKYDTDTAEMGVFIESIENNDFSRLGDLLNTKKRYEQFARELTAVATPVGIEDIHLDMINNVYGIAVSLGYLSQLEGNSANAFAGVALYKIYDANLQEASDRLREYLTRYGILKGR